MSVPAKALRQWDPYSLTCASSCNGAVGCMCIGWGGAQQGLSGGVPAHSCASDTGGSGVASTCASPCTSGGGAMAGAGLPVSICAFMLAVAAWQGTCVSVGGTAGCTHASSGGTMGYMHTHVLEEGEARSTHSAPAK